MIAWPLTHLEVMAIGTVFFSFVCMVLTVSNDCHSDSSYTTAGAGL